MTEQTIVKYEAYKGKISPLKIERGSVLHTYVKLKQDEGLRDDESNVFDTWDEAHAYILDRALAESHQAYMKSAKADTELARIIALQEPKA